MFTGIIEDLVEVEELKKNDGYWNMSINTKFKDVKIGASIAINGVCLTVASMENRRLYFDIINETLEKTNLRYLESNDLVNIERCVRLNERLDGHIVQGHIECIGELISKITKNSETKIRIKIESKYMKYCIYKGSIAVDGISLTISNLGEDFIECSIIPHTLKNTTIGIKKIGQLFNIETDMISKYVEKQLMYNKV